MNTQNSIRVLQPSDLNTIKSIIDDNEMFPSAYLDEMTQGYFDKSTDELWYVAENNIQEPIAVAYCAPEQMTENTWNLLLIAVFKKHQGEGIGAMLMQHLEKQLLEHQARLLLVETSGTADYEKTRAFYPKCGYTEVAVIPEYYDVDDDKVVFWKKL